MAIGKEGEERRRREKEKERKGKEKERKGKEKERRGKEKERRGKDLEMPVSCATDLVSNQRPYKNREQWYCPHLKIPKELPLPEIQLLAIFGTWAIQMLV